MGQPLSIAAKVSAQVAQNRERLHGTRIRQLVQTAAAAMRNTWLVSADCVSLTTLYFLFILMHRLLLLLLVVVVLSINGIQHDVERCRVCAKTVPNGAKKLLCDIMIRSQTLYGWS